MSPVLSELAYLYSVWWSPTGLCGGGKSIVNTTNIDEEQGILLIYDIACQYFAHFQDHIGHLLPQGLQIDAGIGSFHVHGHKNECFF